MLATFKPTAQTEPEVAKQTGALLAQGAKGHAVLHDIDVYVAGINAYLRTHNHSLGPFSGVSNFSRTDIYAFSALKDQFVGEGGGQEAANAEFLSGLERRLGAGADGGRGMTCARSMILRHRSASPGTCSSSPHLAVRPAMWYSTTAVCRGPPPTLGVDRSRRAKASNILMVSGARSASDHPIMVAGPQIGYYYPGLTLEMDLHAPGISQRGVTTAPSQATSLSGAVRTTRGR
jgi:acyl-homoserine lactone acylase PvdQ